MPYLVPVAVILIGLVAETIVEVSAELSTGVLIDADAGVDVGTVPVVSNGIVDMTPETALAIFAE